MEARKYNLPFITQVLKLIPSDEMRALADKHQTDVDCKGFTSLTHLLTMVYAQLAGCDSLRDLVGGMATSSERVHELFLNILPTKSTISYNNKNRDWHFFKEAFEVIATNINRRLPKNNNTFKFENKLYSFDSTTISLSCKIFDWAHCILTP